MSPAPRESGNVVILTVLGVATLLAITAAIIVFVGKSEDRKQTSNATTAPLGENSQTPKQPDTSNSDDVKIKNDITLLSAKLEEYAAGNRGAYPLTSSAVKEFSTSHIQTDPALIYPGNMKAYELVQTEPKNNEVLYLVGRKCNSDGSLSAVEKPKRYILQAKLTSGKPYCVDNG